MSGDEERDLLRAHKEALKREIKFIALEIGRYEVSRGHNLRDSSDTNSLQKRQAALEGENGAVERAESVGSSDNSMMIDPALLASEPLNSEIKDNWIFSHYVTDGRLTRQSARIAAAGNPMSNLVITDDILAVDNDLAMEDFQEF